LFLWVNGKKQTRKYLLNLHVVRSISPFEIVQTTFFLLLFIDVAKACNCWPKVFQNKNPDVEPMNDVLAHHNLL
jgi:hypothetical protein